MRELKIKEYLRNELCELRGLLGLDFSSCLFDSVIIAGGAITSLLQGEKPKDIDIYFSNYEDMRTFVSKLMNLMNLELDYIDNGTAGIQIKNKFCESKSKDDITIFVTENAITINKKFQVITRFTGDPDDLVKNFDFLHTKCYYHYKTNKLDLPASSLVSILSKQLVFTNSAYPLCALFRIKKFMRRGWTISVGELTKISLRLSMMNLLDPKVLRDQLTGVDIAYLADLTRILKKREENGMEEDGVCSDLSIEYITDIIDNLTGVDGDEEVSPE